ncbi:hypothetical protein ACQP25_44970 (plasmid) [Microtetraspora malaysiensis]|uniref:hypothetical protein n=1 Tax=Microtetraspora malaysiensis TaxID=161358 RepID=UPI003D8C4F78
MEVVDPDKVAVRAGLPLPLSPGHRAAVEEAIEDALAQVASHISQSPIPERYTERHVWPDGSGGWALEYGPLIEVESAVAETDPGGRSTGAYTVTYRAGLDPCEDRTYGRVLRRFVAWAAANSPIVARFAQDVPGARIRVSESVEGQSATYESPKASAPGSAGADPTIEDLNPWRRITAYQRPGIAPHPMDSGLPWWS